MIERTFWCKCIGINVFLRLKSWSQNPTKAFNKTFKQQEADFPSNPSCFFRNWRWNLRFSALPSSYICTVPFRLPAPNFGPWRFCQTLLAEAALAGRSVSPSGQMWGICVLMCSLCEELHSVTGGLPSSLRPHAGSFRAALGAALK